MQTQSSASVAPQKNTRRCFTHALRRPLACLLGAVAVSASALAAPPSGRGKIVYTGWDSPTSTQFRRDIDHMADAPFDGTTLWIRAKGEDLPEGMNGTPFRTVFSRYHWQQEWFAHAIDDIRAAQAAPGPLKHNFLRLDANPGDVDWFDDAGWREIVDHFRIAARIVRESGLEGIVFDAEPYTKPFVPFDYKAQPEAAKHSFAEYRAKARQRGAEVMTAMGEECDRMTVLTFFMLSYLVDSNRYHGPTAVATGDPDRMLFLHAYGLYPAFLNGWLDVLPPDVRLVDGNEHAYGYSTPEQFHVAASKIRNLGQELIDPTNRPAYRSRVDVGSGIYLDAHSPAVGNPYELPGAGADLLERNVAAALAAADGYIWLYGEKGSFWPDPGDLREWATKEHFPPWEARAPGFTAALRRARAPIAARARDREEEYRAAMNAPGDNALVNGDFSIGAKDGATGNAALEWEAGGAPEGWQTWQEESSAGTFGWDEDRKAAVARGVRAGVFLQRVPVQPGERRYAGARSRVSGVGAADFSIGWQDAQSRWLPGDPRIRIVVPVAVEGEWECWGAAVEVPENAAYLVLQLGVHGQPSPDDRLWWDDAAVRPWQGGYE